MSALVQDILSIAGNAAVFRDLQKDLGSGNTVAFVGAGASAELYPLWNRLIQMLADHAVEVGRAQPAEARRWTTATGMTPQQVVDRIRRALGDSNYHDFLRRTFAPHENRYTSVDAALMKLPFKGFVTTNYDLGLDYARSEYRHRCLDTGTPTWQDEEIVARWYDRSVFAADHSCPIFWLHGVVEKPKSIVLSASEYFNIYRPGLFKRLFDSLWGQSKLVFVGYGFGDPHIAFMLGEFLRDMQAGGTPARHYAFIGIETDSANATPDFLTIREQREYFEEDYFLRPIFYSVFQNDHSSLKLLLDHLGTSQGPLVSQAGAQQTSQPQAVVVQHWAHGATNDEQFLGRIDEIARLDRWANDPETRCIGVSAVGGTGKTALIGHWLKQTSGWQVRDVRGVFAWSFGDNSNPAQFLQEFVLWALGDSIQEQDRQDVLKAAMRVLLKNRYLIVLDGLELLQEGPGDTRYGAFLDPNLNKLLTGLCRASTAASLAIVTSRFTFADLERHIGTSYRQIELGGLSTDDSAMLLERLDVHGDARAKETVGQSLKGHPLALRVFVEALPDEDRDQPDRFLARSFDAASLNEHSTLNQKLMGLLKFYGSRLPPLQQALLSTIALTSSPMANVTVFRFLQRIFPAFAALSDSELERNLQSLNARQIVMAQPSPRGEPGSTCHPVLRDYFRTSLLNDSEKARTAADLLSGGRIAPPETLEAMDWWVQSIQILIDIGDLHAAQNAYDSNAPDASAVRGMLAHRLAFVCELGFIGSEAAEQECLRELGSFNTACHLHAAALFSANATEAVEFASKAAELVADDPINASQALRVLAGNQAALGRLSQAAQTYSRAIDLARDFNSDGLACALTGRAEVLRKLGRLQEAFQDVIAADLFDARNGRDGDTRPCGHNSTWVRVLADGNQMELAKSKLDALLPAVRIFGDKSAQRNCHLLLADLDLDLGDVPGAAEAFKQATLDVPETDFSSGAHIVGAELALHQNDLDGARFHAEEGLAVATNADDRLSFSRALMTRAAIRINAGSIDDVKRGLDDLDDALRIAEETDYKLLRWHATQLRTKGLRKLAILDPPNASSHLLRAQNCDLGSAVALRLSDEQIAAAREAADAWLGHPPETVDRFRL